jgi:hypothetical protein
VLPRIAMRRTESNHSGFHLIVLASRLVNFAAILLRSLPGRSWKRAGVHVQGSGFGVQGFCRPSRAGKDFWASYPGRPLADSLCPGLFSFAPLGLPRGARLFPHGHHGKQRVRMGSTRVSRVRSGVPPDRVDTATSRQQWLS